MYNTEIISSSEQYEKYYSERFIYDKELLNVVEIMKTHDHYRILILGAPGSGKSTLLRLLSQYTKNKAPIDIIRGCTIRERNFNFLHLRNAPLFVDGLDEIENPYRLLQFLNNRNCNKLVCANVKKKVGQCLKKIRPPALEKNQATWPQNA